MQSIIVSLTSGMDMTAVDLDTSDGRSASRPKRGIPDLRCRQRATTMRITHGMTH